MHLFKNVESICEFRVNSFQIYGFHGRYWVKYIWIQVSFSGNDFELQSNDYSKMSRQITKKKLNLNFAMLFCTWFSTFSICFLISSVLIQRIFPNCSNCSPLTHPLCKNPNPVSRQKPRALTKHSQNTRESERIKPPRCDNTHTEKNKIASSSSSLTDSPHTHTNQNREIVALLCWARLCCEREREC